MTFKILENGFNKLALASALQLSEADKQRVNLETANRKQRMQSEFSAATSTAKDLTAQAEAWDRRVGEIKVRIAEAEKKVAKEDREMKVKNMIGDAIEVGKAVVALLDRNPDRWSQLVAAGTRCARAGRDGLRQF